MDSIETVEEGQNIIVCISLMSSGSSLGYPLTIDLDVTGSAKAGCYYIPQYCIFN